MSSRRGQNFMVGAVLASVVFHVVAMCVFKSQVMTEYESIASRPRAARHRATFRKSQDPDRPIVISTERLKNRPEAKEEPKPLTGVQSSAQAAMLSQGVDKELPPAPARLEAVAAPEPDQEQPQRLFAKVEVAETPVTLSEYAPLVQEVGFGQPSDAASGQSPAAESWMQTEAEPATGPLDIEPPKGGVPSFAMDPVPEQALSIVEATAKEEEKKPDFVPPQQVMDEIDEKVVAAEQKAVRDLLDVKKPRQMNSFVDVGVNSAEAGEWTYFRVRVSPKDTQLAIVPKDVVILIDASGSIADDRLKSCRAAAKEILRTCMNTGDRFNLVAFRNDFDYAFRTWQTCNQTSFDAADKWMNRLTAHGRTDVFSTIRSVLKLPRDPRRPLVALVVTDGDANTGVSKTADILSQFTALNDGLVSVYMYGVKQGANRELIDVLTHGNRGESFIYEGNRKYAGRKIGDLSTRFRDPVLSDLRVVFTTGSKADVYPRRLKNLYRGESVDIIGRVPKGTTQVAFSLKGLNGPRAYQALFKVNLGVGGLKEFDPNLPARWLQEQKIDQKLK